MYMRNPGAATFLAVLLASACVPARTGQPATIPGEPAADPVGTYEFTSGAGGERFAGEIRVTRAADGAYAGTVAAPAVGELPVRSVTVSGQRIRITARGAQGDAAADLELSGSSFVGTWRYGASRGFLAGTRRPDAATPPGPQLPSAGEPSTDYTGSYEVAAVPARLRIFAQDGFLMAQAAGQRAFPLLYRGAHRFDGPAATGVALDFTVAEGRATGFTLRQGAKDYVGRRVP